MGSEMCIRDRSWCGRRFHPHKVGERDGWENVNAVVNQDIHEIKSAVILQPGPASLSEGIDQLYAITKKWHDEQ